MTIFDKLQQLHPLIIIVLIACVLWYFVIIYKVSRYSFMDSLRCIISIICSTIIMLALVISFIKTNDLERFESLVIMTYMSLTVILNILN